MKADDICTVLVYTQNGAIPFDVVVAANDFQDRVAQALEEGTVILELADGGKLVLCAINVVAIEIHEAVELKENSDSTPPVKNN